MSVKRISTGLTCVLLLAGVLALQGCRQGRTADAAPSTGAGSVAKGAEHLAFIAPNLENPWIKLQLAYVKMAADERGSQLHTFTLTGTKPEDVQSAFGAATATKSVGLLIHAPSENIGLDMRDLAESYAMKMLSLNVRPKDPSTKKYLDLPYLGVEDRDLGTVAAQSALEEAAKRGWTDDQTGVVLYFNKDGGKFQARTTAMAESLAADGFKPAQVRLLPWTPGTDMTAATSNALNGYKNWLILAPADAPALEGVRASEAKGLPASQVIGLSIGGLGVLDELKKPDTGFFGTLLISPKVHGYDAAMTVLKAAGEGTKIETLPTFDNGILTTRANLAQVIKDQMLDKLPAGSDKVQP